MPVIMQNYWLLQRHKEEFHFRQLAGIPCQLISIYLFLCKTVADMQPDILFSLFKKTGHLLIPFGFAIYGILLNSLGENDSS
jgi:hypothetical protein